MLLPYDQEQDRNDCSQSFYSALDRMEVLTSAIKQEKKRYPNFKERNKTLFTNNMIFIENQTESIKYL